jgi:hypothetical protein
MPAPVRIVGSYLSPYVRKVLVCLHVKGIAYQIDPIVPFLGDDRFSRLSPLRRIPVLTDDTVTLCDSSVIPRWVWTQRDSIPLRDGFLNLWHASVPVGERVLDIDGVCTVQLRGGLIASNHVLFDRSELLAAIRAARPSR